MTSMVVSETWERHAHNEILELVDLLSKLREVETMARGFVITGDEKYLEPYKTALTVIERKHELLRSMERVNPLQQKSMTNIVSLIAEKLAMVEENINLRRTKGFQTASQAMMTGRGKWLMDEISRLVSKSQNDGVRLLQEQEIVDMADTRKAIRLILTGTILSLTLLCSVFILHRREIDRGIKSEEELREHRDHLEHLIQERTAQLEQAKLDAEVANHAKSEFLENMSHEMRNALSGVMGVIDLLLTNCRKEEDRHYLEMAKMSAGSLKRLINDIIDFSRISTGNINFVMEPFDLRHCVRTVAGTFVAPSERKGLRFLLEIDEGVPVQVVGDEGRLRQVLECLLSNAVKFTESGEIRLSVRPADNPDKRERDVLQFVVRDTGTGIPSEYMESIFNMFTHADITSKKKFGGVGLGLALVKQIVANMGGKIWVESSYGSGSMFTFAIPFGKPAP
jgi:signal transduction histidine kinase